MSEWIDISVELREGLVVWPGDPPFEISAVASMARGDACNVSAIAMTCHAGTHIDAPRHFFDSGAAADRAPFEALIGPARVVEAVGPITADRIDALNVGRGERLLFKTGGRIDTLAPDAAERLVQLGVRLVGIDGLTIGYPKIADVHRTLLGAGIWILEGLDLARVQPGDYELVCLPLKIAGADGAPARALLKETLP